MTTDLPTRQSIRPPRAGNGNVYLLGAGFSADAGLPTIADFLNQMRDSTDWLGQQGRQAELTAVEAVLEFRPGGAALRRRSLLISGSKVNRALLNQVDLKCEDDAGPRGVRVNAVAPGVIQRLREHHALKQGPHASHQLQGQPCGQVVTATQQGDNDYIAPCQDGSRYRVFVNAQGRVVVQKQ